MAVWTKTRRCGGACSDGTRTRRQIILSDARACLRERGGTHGAACLSSSGVSHLQHTPHCSDNQYKWQGLFALYQPTSFPLARPHSLLPVNASKRGRRPVLRGESNPREWRSCGFGSLARVSAKSLGQNSRNQNSTNQAPQSIHEHAHTPPSERMLHCVSFFSAGFSLAGPTSHVKLHSAAVPLSRSSVPFAAAAAADNVDEVELRFRDLEVTKERAPEVLALMEEHSFPLGLAQRAVES